MMRQTMMRIMVGTVVGTMVWIMAGITPPARADPVPETAPAISPDYVSLVALAESSRLILKAEIRRTAIVDSARALDVRPGWARLYVEAQPLATLAGEAPVLPVVHYLVDVPLDTRGRPPVLKKLVVLLFARPVAQADEIQLVAPDAEWVWSPELETRAYHVLAELAAPDAPDRITGVRELSYVPGTLTGAGETQIFLTTARNQPASISVEHAPGVPVRWSLSFSEVANASGQPPARDTLAWYRLACSLPGAPPAGINISDTEADKAQAARDYALVMASLGPCR